MSAAAKAKAALIVTGKEAIAGEVIFVRAITLTGGIVGRE